MAGPWITPFVGKIVAASLLAAGVLVTAGSTAEACTARFTCSPGVSPTCWFRMFYRSGQTAVITVPAGGERRIFGLSPGDRYCSSNRGVPGTGCGTTRIRMAC